MTRLLRNTLAVSALAAVSALTASAEELCSLKSSSYSSAMHLYPEAMAALSTVEKASVATWYTDRESAGDYAATAKKLVETCSDTTRLSMVVYGLPNKDCEAGASAVGSRNNNAADYEAFIKTLADTVGTRKALYVLEPDAVGLLAKEGGCGAAAGYKPNLLKAIQLLSSNPNAEIYVDTGYWALEYPESAARVVSVIKELQTAGPVKGITLNTANYRSTVSMAQLCSKFQDAMGTTDLNCIVDTSRNFETGIATATTDEWCNLKSAGIGHPPTDDTGYSNLDYFLWLKPPGESDGDCSSRTSDAMRGPGAGDFFYDGFKSLWNQGYFVNELKMAKIGEVAAPTPAPTTPVTTPAPTSTTVAPTVTPVPTTTQPVVVPTQAPVTTEPPVATLEPILTPEPTTTTEAPIFQRPITVDPSLPSGDAGSTVGGDNDGSPIQNDPTTAPIGGEATTIPTPAPSQPRPTPAVSSFRESVAPMAVTQSNVENDFGKRLLNGIMIFFVGAVAVLGAVIMINRARENRLKKALYYKQDSFSVNVIPHTPQSILEASPANHFRAL